MTAQDDIDDITRYAEAALNGLPLPFRDLCQDVLLQVTDWPPQDILDELEIDDPLELTGLYDGIPMTEKSNWDVPHGPDVVWLFRRPILDEWAERGDVTVAEMVAHVTVHEFAHHFGWSDDDIAAIDQWWL